jgi:HEAT repeat protein/thioredoxin-related protein
MMPVRALGQIICAVLSGCLLLVSPSNAAESTRTPPTFHASLKVAAEAALPGQSLVLLVFGAEWCAPCKALEKDSLGSKAFREGGGPLCVAEVDIDADEKTAARFGVNAVPTLFLLSGDGKIVARQTGYMDAAGLMNWIEEGRKRARAGQWEGTAPGLKIDGLLAKAAGTGLDTNDLVQLVAMLGDPDPGERVSAERLLVAQREKAVPPLLAALTAPYLGARIGASEALQRLIPDAPRVDPWQPVPELKDPVATLEKWWSATGRLPPRGAIQTNDASTTGSIQAALDELNSDDPIRRTDAMSTLTGHGPAALPAVREAIKRHERTNPKVVALLEDVRWSILIPDTLERKTGGVRSALSRGSSAERQAAATRLGRAGRGAIDALAELANDPDSLVVESAVRALSGIGGSDVLPAMAALLKASDSNLRMTAAQALGRTKSVEATPHLLAALEDPNEVVACAALTALDEVNAKESPFNPAPGSKEPLGPEAAAALKKTLSDPRWRVRATAAQVIGKLKVEELADELKKLLDDSDGFVVKSVLVALTGLGSQPEPEQLLAVARRLPTLQSDAVAMLSKSGSGEAVTGVLGLFDRGGVDSQIAIISSLVLRDRYSQQPVDEAWKPVLQKAVVSTDAGVRRTAVSVLGMAPPPMAAELVGTLLADGDRDIRDQAATVVLGILSGQKPTALGALANLAMSLDLDEETSSFDRSGSSKTKPPATTPEQRSKWYSALSQRPDGELTPLTAAMLLATGDSNRELPRLVIALSNAGPAQLELLGASPGIKVIAPRLPWPGSLAVLQQFGRSPTLYLRAATEHQQMAKEAGDYLLDPARFRTAVEAARGDALKLALTLPRSSSESSTKKWSLLSTDVRTRGIVDALSRSTNAAWRAAAVFVRGRNLKVADVPSTAAFLKDSNAWVRAAAAQALANAGLAREELEKYLEPLVGEADPHVTAMAALGLLEPELRYAAGYQWQFAYFQFEDVQVGSSDSYGITEQRPPTVLTNRPAYLDAAQRRISTLPPEEATPLALLLVQHGVFDGLDQILKAEGGVESRGHTMAQEALLTAMNLTQDAKYIPIIRNWMEGVSNEWELRRFLKAVRGMTGADARQLRLDINRRLRAPSSSQLVE